MLSMLNCRSSYLTQSQYNDTRPSSLRADPGKVATRVPVFKLLVSLDPEKKPTAKVGIEPGSAALDAGGHLNYKANETADLLQRPYMDLRELTVSHSDARDRLAQRPHSRYRVCRLRLYTQRLYCVDCTRHRC